jgi:UDP-glucose 4-epimerase
VNVLVTGGAGFMGSHVVDSLLRMNEPPLHKIVVLDDLSGGCIENVPHDPRVLMVVGSINDRDLVNGLFQQHSFEHVYHLAAYAAEGLSHFIRSFNYSNNLLGSVNLINAAVNHQSKTFVFTSSIAVYGNAPSPLSEVTHPSPIDPYGISKYAVELDLHAASDLFGLNFVIFRPHNVYGERQNLADKYRNVVGIFMNRLIHGLPMPIFGDGTQQRAFSYIGDVAPTIASAPWMVDAQRQTFNLGADQPYSINELAKLVSQAIGKPGLREHHAARHEVHVAFCDHQKVRRVFPQQSNTSLEEGLMRMGLWAKSANIRPTQSFDPIEIERNLPASWKT